MAKKTVVIVPMPGTFMLDIAGPCDVFAAADALLHDGLGTEGSGYNILLAAYGDDKIVPTKSGITMICPLTLDEITQPIDTLIVAGFPMVLLQSGDRRLINWLKNNYPRLRRVGSICVGTYALAEAGILEGKNATTHWEHSRSFQERYPSICVDTNPFYTKDGNVYTSGGVSSGVDLAMALVEEDYGREVAIQVARKLVLYLKRPGYQSQFANLLQLHSVANSLAGKLRPWILEHLDKEMGVEELATHLNMSIRNFTRVFTRETGMTPAKFVEKLRVEIARKYLEDSDYSMEQIATRCGLGGVVSMRRVFLRHMNVTPSDYRRTFRTSFAD
ncbi:GlxA family transcriptional regulator [Chitinophaga sancti]|uniref:GlxA family transcriptional regulator n=1 Tax=Chitinophaga sancti TaxID=1004 RepID=A0A1K1MH40_9BACT|nr:GlxA family transcriptional regulator [Chitinophaga sancti]WQD62678.1 GlxA family transcriptional regulator [Chitinophaga sancti]WQG91698.1 GlxA family transcriptional regulator [Chitinophaga sancti]SFW22385.1 Transcriptional regulator GlxA family, contains an amidase domain and an AraC-type DNA-binding HTH domain [Chitinophaga sancti]